MIGTVDTSDEAVAHLVGMLPDWRGEGPSDALDAALVQAAATLRALAAERDALLAALRQIQSEALEWGYLGDEAMEAVATAIAKAEGRAP